MCATPVRIRLTSSGLEVVRFETCLAGASGLTMGSGAAERSRPFEERGDVELGQLTARASNRADSVRAAPASANLIDCTPLHLPA